MTKPPLTRCDRCRRPWTRAVSADPDGIVCRACARVVIAELRQQLASLRAPSETTPAALVALVDRVEAWRALSREMGWVIGSNRLEDELKHEGMDVDALAADLARRLTEQDAEIARLKRVIELQDMFGKVQVNETAIANRRAAAAEQALAAARRERDEARALCERYVVDLCNERAARVNEARTP